MFDFTIVTLLVLHINCFHPLTVVYATWYGISCIDKVLLRLYTCFTDKRHSITTFALK